MSIVTFVKGDVTFEQVHFRYEDLARPILDGVDLEVRAGQTLAIVGPSAWLRCDR